MPPRSGGLKIDNLLGPQGTGYTEGTGHECTLQQLRLAVHEVAFEVALNIWLHVAYLVSGGSDVSGPSLAPEIVGKSLHESLVFWACRAFHHRIVFRSLDSPLKLCTG